MTGSGEGEGGALVCAFAPEAPGWRPMGLSHLLLPQELLLRANLEEMRCAMPRARAEPPEQVRPRSAPAAPWRRFLACGKVATRWASCVARPSEALEARLAVPLGSAPRAGLSVAGSSVGVGPKPPREASPWVSRMFPDFRKLAFTISIWKQPTACLSAKTKEGSRVEECGCRVGVVPAPTPGPPGQQLERTEVAPSSWGRWGAGTQHGSMPRVRNG